MAGRNAARKKARWWDPPPDTGEQALGPWTRADADARVKWLLDFGTRPPIPAEGAAWREAAREATKFLMGPVEGLAPSGPSGPGELQRAQREAHRILQGLGQERMPHVQLRRGPLYLLKYEDGWLDNRLALYAMPWADAFRLAIYDALVAVKDRFHFCPECNRPFIAQKRQRYCGLACSQRVRTRKYRTEKRDKFRAWRRDYYRRQQRGRYGAKVKVGTRRSKES